MSERFVSLDVCRDCYYVLANGVDDEHGERAHKGMLAVWGGNYGAVLIPECVEDDCDCAETGDGAGFSWSRCDGCHSTLGGDREHAAYDRCELGDHDYGAFELSRFAGTPHRRCAHCHTVTLDGDDETAGDAL